MAESDYKPKSGTRSFAASVFLHALILLVIALSAFVKFKSEKKDRPKTDPDKVFEMVSDQEVAQIQAPQKAPQTPPPPSPFQVTQPRDVRPINLPPPPPTPEPPPAQRVNPTNTPKPQPTVSYADFRRDHNIPQPRNQTRTQAPKPINVQSITVNTTRLAPQRTDARTYSGRVTQDEFKAYIARVYAMAKQNWIPPTEIGGMHLQAEVRLVIDPRGKVKSVQILSSSGEKVFDDSIVKLFNSISFTTPPRGETFKVDFKFNTTD